MGTLPTRRLSPLLPYAACFVVCWGLIGLESRLRPGEVAIALALQIVVGAALVAMERGNQRRWLAFLGIIFFLASVVLLRDGVLPTPGYGALVLLPVIWAALRGRRGELILALAGAGLVLFAPLLLVGGAQYQASGWRSGGVVIVVAAVVGVTVLELVGRLRASEERHRLLAENSTDLVTRVSLDGTITYASSAAEALLGYAPGELVGRGIVELTADGQAPDYALDVDAMPSEAALVELLLRHRDGSELWFEASVREVRGPDGAATEWQAAIRPLEERKRLQLTVERQRDEAEQMLASEDALRKIATLVATGAEPGEVFAAVAEQIAGLLGGQAGGVVRFDGRAGTGEIVGAWSAADSDITGMQMDLSGTSATATVYRTGAPARVAGEDDACAVTVLDWFAVGGAIAAPIHVGGRLWGSAGTAFPAGTPIPPGAEERLTRFADLVAVTIANAAAWETLSHRAATDAITGLANNYTFHERLSAEVERASRHGRALSLAVFDLDHFKRVNDTYGHQTGDDVLAAVGRRLAAIARTGELMARIGGEEFAWLMPETTEHGAYLAAERARAAISATPFEGVGSLTMSAGVACNQHATTAHELFGAADQALYRAKRNGRNATFMYAQPQPAAAGLVG
jgi:diguanylate cyclase (GGDEF)-like protein/PAS domain S-box-containing protein